MAAKIVAAIGKGRCKVKAAEFSPDHRHLAVCAEVRTLLGFRVDIAGLVFAIEDQSIIGRVAQGRRYGENWSKTKN
jgi:hypothetical protein